METLPRIEIVPGQPPKISIHFISKNRVEVERGFTLDLGHGWEVSVPGGFVSDGASIPRYAWFFAGSPFAGDTLIAALVHDYLCDQAWKYRDYTLRCMADAAFRRVLKLSGVSYWKRAIYYQAVWLWGYASYMVRT